mmetsp:Transcript_77357/g.224439  ORF Transcript_77357/g.224439 Transcript_77357/m.224439 type:complete len:121 (-) Transcript_77357:61-423(-)
MFSGFDSSAAGCVTTTSSGEQVAVVRLYSRTLTCEGSPTYTTSSDDEDSKAIINGDCGALVSSSLGVGYLKLEAAVPIACKCEDLDRMLAQASADLSNGERIAPGALFWLSVAFVARLLH